MIEETISTILEDLVSEAFGGLFRAAPNRRIRRLKILAWFSLVASAAFVVGAFVVQVGWFPPVAFLTGAAFGVLFFVFGIWASVARVRFQTSDDSQPSLSTDTSPVDGPIR